MSQPHFVLYDFRIQAVFVFDLLWNTIIGNNGIQVFHSIETIERIAIKLTVISYHIFLYRIVQNNGIAISFFFISCRDTMTIDSIDPDKGFRNFDFFQEFIGKLTDKGLCLYPVATTN